MLGEAREPAGAHEAGTAPARIEMPTNMAHNLALEHIGTKAPDLYTHTADEAEPFRLTVIDNPAGGSLLALHDAHSGTKAVSNSDLFTGMAEQVRSGQLGEAHLNNMLSHAEAHVAHKTGWQGFVDGLRSFVGMSEKYTLTARMEPDERAAFDNLGMAISRESSIQNSQDPNLARSIIKNIENKTKKALSSEALGYVISLVNSSRNAADLGAFQTEAAKHIGNILGAIEFTDDDEGDDAKNAVTLSLGNMTGELGQANFGIANHNFVYNGLAQDLEGTERDRADNTVTLSETLGLIGISNWGAREFPAGDEPAPFNAVQQVSLTRDGQTESANIRLDFGNVTRSQAQKIAAELESIINHEGDDVEVVSKRLQEANLFSEEQVRRTAEKIIQYRTDTLARVEDMRSGLF